MAGLEDLAEPPMLISPDGDGIAVHAADPGGNAERTALVETALAGRSDLSVTRRADQSLSIRYAAGAPDPAPVSEARLDALKLHPAQLVPLGEGRLSVAFATSEDAAAFRRGFMASGFAIRVVDDSTEDARRPPSPGDEHVPRMKGQPLWLEPTALITGDMIADAEPGVGRNTGDPVIKFRLTDEGRARFAAVTAANVGRRFAIVLNGVILYAPKIQSAIVGGEGEIHGDFTEESAAALARSMLSYRDDLPLKLAAPPAGR
jgi:preprotein translocase subunit SecD